MGRRDGGKDVGDGTAIAAAQSSTENILKINFANDSQICFSLLLSF